MVTVTEQQRARQLWDQYRRRPDDTARNALVEHYLPLVKHTASRMAKRLPRRLDFDDLVSAGTFGLIDAVGRFDPARGFKFTTYCVHRIRGAIRDELRATDWMPRCSRDWGRKIDRAGEVLRDQLGRTPSQDELAAHMNISAERLRGYQRFARQIRLDSLDRDCSGGDGYKELLPADILADKRAIDPLAAACRSDVRDLLTEGLTRSEQLLIILYYYEQMTLKEAGKAVGFSESRASQVRKAVLARLKRRIETRHPEMARSMAQMTRMAEME